MRRVRKASEPPCLAACRRELRRELRETGRISASDWDKLGDCAREVRAALVRDQDGLCAYCGRRLIRPPEDLGDESGAAGFMKIEHFEARSLAPERMFDWDNLLGVCSGHFIIGGHTITTCDSARGNRPLHIHPVTHPRDPAELFPIHAGRLRDDRGNARLGEVFPQNDDALADTTTLHLNASPLIGDRARVIRDLRVLLSKDDSPAAIRRLLRVNTIAGSGGLPPYAHVAAAYLHKKLRSRTASP